MEYKEGMKVQINDIDWFINSPKNEAGNINFSTNNFIKKMTVYCGHIATIKSITTRTSGTKEYTLIKDYDSDIALFTFEDWMFKPVSEVDTKNEPLKLGDTVTIKSQEWYDNNTILTEGRVKSPKSNGNTYSFIKEMCNLCGKTFTISEVHEPQKGLYYYKLKDSDNQPVKYNWHKWMFEDKTIDFSVEASDLKVGDYARVKSLDWYKSHRHLDYDGDIVTTACPGIFLHEMSDFCGKLYKIEAINGNECRLQNTNKELLWYPWMFEEIISKDKVEINSDISIGDTIKIINTEYCFYNQIAIVRSVASDIIGVSLLCFKDKGYSYGIERHEYHKSQVQLIQHNAVNDKEGDLVTIISKDAHILYKSLISDRHDLANIEYLYDAELYIEDIVLDGTDVLYKLSGQKGLFKSWMFNKAKKYEVVEPIQLKSEISTKTYVAPIKSINIIVYNFSVGDFMRTKTGRYSIVIGSGSLIRDNNTYVIFDIESYETKEISATADDVLIESGKYLKYINLNNTTKGIANQLYILFEKASKLASKIENAESYNKIEVDNAAKILKHSECDSSTFDMSKVAYKRKKVY